MASPNAARSGTFKIGGDVAINRLGYGAMRITGQGIWGEPANKAEALRTLKRLPEPGASILSTRPIPMGRTCRRSCCAKRCIPIMGCSSQPRAG